MKKYKSKPVKAWGWKTNGKLYAWAFPTKEAAKYYAGFQEVVRVEIRELSK